ncbi:MAG: glycoside hydrolase [Bacteroidales bacterium]|nr:MAG: glycoside hydrolase [Bacteroidales bacterium]
MSILKDYNKKSLFCKVTFKLPTGTVSPESQVCITGEFNNWDISDLPMKKLKSGEFTISVDLEKGKEYQFKYIVDGRQWINEIDADRFIVNGFNSENSVVVT